MKLTDVQIEERERFGQAEMKRELEKVKRRRIEREREKEARDSEMSMLCIPEKLKCLRNGNSRRTSFT